MIPLGSAAAVLQLARGVLAPPPKMTVSEFCDASLTVPTGPMEGTRWRTDYAPYQRAMLDAFDDDPRLETIVIQGGSQWGKTSILLNICAYFIAYDPCPILTVLPTRDMAKDFSVARLQPLIDRTDVLSAVVAEQKPRGGSNTQFQKMFAGGMIVIGGANSAASLASRSIRVLMMDEIDRYPDELPREGGPMDIALARTKAYGRRKRVVICSSPTIVDTGIHFEFQQGDQRYYWVPCPECGAAFRYRWKYVRWEPTDPNTARIYCPHCRHGLDDAQRIEQLQAGEWVAENPERDDKTVASFHIWEAYSPFVKLSRLAIGFAKALAKQKAGDHRSMHTFQNTALGEPIEREQGAGVDPHKLMLRRETYRAAAPDGVALITLGVDVQDDRLELLAIGWGLDDESWMIDRGVIVGDTSMPQPWQQLLEALGQTYEHERGVEIPISATAIDSAGHRTDEVYDFCARHGTRRVYACIGRADTKGKPTGRPLISTPSARGWGGAKRKVPLYTIGVDSGKALLMSRLNVPDAGPGHVHFPTEAWADDEFFAQLTAERLVTRHKRGAVTQFWKTTRPRNEMLDCAVLAMAASKICNPDLEQLLEEIRGEHVPAKKPETKTEDRWIKKRETKNWLDRGKPRRR